MKYIDLPGTDFHVSRVAFGTWGIGGPPFWNPIEEKEALDLLNSAYDGGINFFDTAPVYGLGYAEELLRKTFGNSDKVIIASKTGLRWKDKTRRSIYPDLSSASLNFEIEQSLKRLGRDVIDVYQVHLPDPKTPIEETFTALGKLQDAGKIRYIGVSNYTVEMIISAKKFATISTCQPRFNFLDQKASASLLPYCEKNKIGTLIYSPLASGLLTGKYNKDSVFDDWRSGNYADLFAESKKEQTQKTITKIQNVAQNSGVSMSRMMLEWTLRQSGVTAVLAGLRKKEHINDALLAGEISLDGEIFEEIISSKT